MTVLEELNPTCPVCGKPMSMNLRADDTFIQDEGWYAASNRFASFLSHHGVTGGFGFINVPEPPKSEKNQKILYLEAGVGANTPVLYSLRTIENKEIKVRRQQNSEFALSSGDILVDSCVHKTCIMTDLNTHCIVNI